jgi:predicted RecB family nuclease
MVSHTKRNNNHIAVSSAAFSAYLHCKLKGSLVLRGETGTPNQTTLWSETKDEEFNASAAKFLRSRTPGAEIFDGLPTPDILRDGRYRILLRPVVVRAGIHADLHAAERLPGTHNASASYRTVRYSRHEKLSHTDKLAAAFDAIALSKVVGTISETARIIHGRNYKNTTVHLPKLVLVANALIAEIAARQNRGEPIMAILNKHCASCQFQVRCREGLQERDDLSLLTTVDANARAKLNRRGILTVAQLSYTYRQRRSSKRGFHRVQRHEPALKALAIWTARVHVIGQPSFEIPTGAIYLDVEGDPDRDFYYLIGLRYKSDATDVYQAFWADHPAQEEEVWRACARALSDLPERKLIHYGSYETQFLKKMRDRYCRSSGDIEFVNSLLAGATNLVKLTYAQVYFPTYSNSLKEIARYLDFRWSDPAASGLSALMWRSQWEACGERRLKDKIVTYNAEDCEAVQKVAERISAICSGQPSQEGASFEAG